jgi:hypothetical protein
MVFTGRVRMNPVRMNPVLMNPARTNPVLMNQAGPTRRRLLGMTVAGLSGYGMSGCGLFGHDEGSSTGGADAVLPLLTEAVALAGAYDKAAAARPDLAARLKPLADDHRAHASALARLLGKAVPTAAPAAIGSGDVLAGLRTAEQTAQRNAVTACKQAPAGRAALIGSIAACRATHAEALR